VDVRLIAATNKHLPDEIKQGAFREDLYYRMNVVDLKIPSLRSRAEDIPLLAEHFLETFAEKNSKSIKGYTPQAMNGLRRYDWPGNVRELMNAVERAVVLSRTEYLDTVDFPALVDQIPQATDGENVELDGMSLEEIEKVAVLRTLDASDGNKSEAARRLGITRKTLHKKLKKYGLMS
jgi:two-component system response regulator HydG